VFMFVFKLRIVGPPDIGSMFPQCQQCWPFMCMVGGLLHAHLVFVGRPSCMSGIGIH
jgi:hypothetical protein